LHVGASSIWVGGLVAIVLAGRRRELREPLMRRFSAVALASVAVLGATGVTRAFGEMTALGQVWGTSYGRLLVLKTGLFAALIAIGWLNRHRVLPSLTRAQRTCGGI
jgi:putative copper export protein